MDLAVVDSINPNQTMNWHCGLQDPKGIEALQWFATNYANNRKYFNGGRSWADLNEGAAFLLLLKTPTATSLLKEQPGTYGLTCWAGKEANFLSSYYESCFCVSIPLFAEDIEASAYLMAELFEGFDGMRKYEDVLARYRETYGFSETELEFFFGKEDSLQYSYWPNGLGEIWKDLDGKFNAFLPAEGNQPALEPVLAQTLKSYTSAIETYVLPNVVSLELYKESGLFH